MFKYLVFALLLSFAAAAPSLIYPAPALVKVVGPAVVPAPGPFLKVVGPAVVPAPIVTKIVSPVHVAAPLHPVHPWW